MGGSSASKYSKKVSGAFPLVSSNTILAQWMRSSRLFLCFGWLPVRLLYSMKNFVDDSFRLFALPVGTVVSVYRPQTAN